MSGKVQAHADVCPAPDGTYSLVLSITGLKKSEALNIGAALGDHVKIAMIKGIRERLNPGSYIIDNRYHKPEETKP